MNTIGIIGQGFVGNAVYEGMKYSLDVYTYDKDPNKQSTADSIGEIVKNTYITFLCVPTPMKKTGECDLSILRAALVEIENEVIAHDKSDYIVVIKSTIPPGTTKKLNKEFEYLQIVFNPEFLTEANAIEDYKNQDKIILGGSRLTVNEVESVFRKVFRSATIIKTTSNTAEMIKYVANTFLALKVSYANEISQICTAAGIDYNEVVNVVKSDERMGKTHWAVPGPDGQYGFSGSCFPKDVQALIYEAKKLGVDPEVLEAAWSKNLKVRPSKDWEKLKGRAVSED